MQLSDVLQRLGLQEDRETIEPGWAESMAALPSGVLPFLEPAFIEEGCAHVGLMPELVSLAVRVAPRIESEPALRALAFHAGRRMYGDAKKMHAWPLPTQALGEDARMFYLLVLLSNWPALRALHQAHRIPSDILSDTFGSVVSRVNSCRRQSGVYGLQGSDCTWLRRHLSGELYRLGRLEFVAREFPGCCVAYRNRRDGRVAALAADGIEFRSDGQRNGASGVTETEGVWKSLLNVRADAVLGHPVDPEAGNALREVVALPSAEWEEALKPGDPVLEVHIPHGSPLKPELCADSVHRAVKFFPRHFSENPAPRAVICSSWLMDPQLEAYLRPDSNIVNFLRQFYLYPVDYGPWAAFHAAFPHEDPPEAASAALVLDRLPQRNSLERAIVAHLRAGRQWRGTGGFLLTADLPWGRQAYRARERRTAPDRSFSPEIAPLARSPQ